MLSRKKIKPSETMPASKNANSKTMPKSSPSNNACAEPSKKKRKVDKQKPPRWKSNPYYSHLPMISVPRNYLPVTSDKDCPPGIYAWVTSENDKVYLVIRQLRYELDKEVHKIKLNAEGKGIPVNSWNGIKSKINSYL